MKRKQKTFTSAKARRLLLAGTALPEGLSVGGALYLSGTQITALPEGLSVGGALDLSGTQITALPEGLSVGGALYLSGTQITAHRLLTPLDGSVNAWCARNAVPTGDTIVIFKRVSAEFKTQEGTANETLWTPGSTLIHPAWAPESEECNGGKFHGCALPRLADRFRNKSGDRYVAIAVATADLFAWRNAQYKGKIAFRSGTVLYECDREGARI